MLLALGLLRFTVDDTIYQTIAEKLEIRFTAHEPVNGRLRHQILGEGEETITFSGTFYPYAHGGLGQLTAFKAQARARVPMILVTGWGHVFGFWYVRMVESTKSKLTKGNVPRKVEFSVELVRA
ncbi:MAG: phage tail protein [Rhizobiales bacterium]|nr:phage tail protein [Hyphomicrobiales bacterium]